MVRSFDIDCIRTACIIESVIEDFSYVAIIGQGYMIVESLSIKYFITQFNSCYIAVRTIGSDGITNYRETEEYEFAALIANASVNTFQFGNFVLVNAAYNNTVFSYFCHVYHLTTNL